MDWQGHSYVIKRMASKPRGRFQRFILAALCRAAFPGHVHPGSLKPGNGSWEAARIEDLARAGVNVPEIALRMSEAVVYSNCGKTLDNVLGQLDPEQRWSVIERALLDLARFHAAGHWHGGAQFRNLVVLPGEDGFCRIDFEEDLGDKLSLPLLQIYDLVQFLSDALLHVPDDSPQRGQQLLATYQAIHWTNVHTELLVRLAWLARPLIWLAPLNKRFGNKDSRRVVALARLLRSQKTFTSQKNNSLTA